LLQFPGPGPCGHITLKAAFSLYGMFLPPASHVNALGHYV